MGNIRRNLVEQETALKTQATVVAAVVIVDHLNVIGETVTSFDWLTQHIVYGL